ncbi:MAG: hypothetical protein M3Q07_06790, partial [Pseudobdellovibrionaceae bacterium]|nr:hypothetical protein [Pseudobdellovibrionaceae bacterium]
MKKYLSLIGLLVLTQQSPAQTTSPIMLGQASIDSTLLEARMYKVIGDRSEALKDLPSSFPVMIFNQKSIDASGATSFTPVGFAVNCKGRDPRAVVNAFGEAFLDIDNPEVVTEEDLNTQFHVAEQPILRCDSLHGQNQASPMFSQVFRVIDRAAKKSYSLVRFNAFSPQDKRLYEVACSNMLDAFWRETDSVKSTVILK